MPALIRLRPGFAVPFLLAALAACGGSSTSSSGSTTTPSPSPAAPAVLSTGSATVAGSSTTVLTTPDGLTLYYLTSDTAAAPKCVAACLSAWPPLLATSNTVSGPADVTGTLTVATNPNGAQVAYNGHLLYRFAADQAKGDAKGEGKAAFGGTWHAATPSLM